MKKLILMLVVVIAFVAAKNFSSSESDMTKAEHVSFNVPDETREFSMGKVELVKIGGATIGRAVFQPGWKWSTSLKADSKTNTCEAPHYQYHVSGTLRVKMDDGTTFDCKPGDLSFLPSGHDAWVVGNEPVVVVDFQGMVDYAKSNTGKSVTK